MKNFIKEEDELVVKLFDEVEKQCIKQRKTAIKNVQEDDNFEISSFRKALPQFFATSAKNLIYMDLGMIISFPTLVIPSLLKPGSDLQFTETTASWFGSIPFICQPVGSIISSLILETLGRKRSMLLVSLLRLIGWYLFYVATSLPVLFVADIIIGLGMGLMEASVILYVAEISEPTLRGVLISTSGIFFTIGVIIESILGTFFNWNTVALISCFVLLVTIFVISQVPESPMWLLSKGKLEKAENSLRWLRGWVPASHIQNELNELMRYIESSKLLSINEKNEKNLANPNANVEAESYIKTSHRYYNIYDDNYETTFRQKLLDFFRPEMLEPFILTIVLFVFYIGSGFPIMRPYMVSVFEELKFPVNANWSWVINSCLGFLGVVICTISVAYVGKRVLILISMLGCAIPTFGLAMWTFFDDSSVESPNWTPFLLYMMSSFSYSLGLASMPWLVLGEVFPLRGRGFAGGCAVAFLYILSFIAVKTFLDLKALLNLSGVFFAYACVTVAGIVFVYAKLPETEGKSLEEIEQFFGGKKYNK